MTKLLILIAALIGSGIGTAHADAEQCRQMHQQLTSGTLNTVSAAELNARYCSLRAATIKLVTNPDAALPDKHVCMEAMAAMNALMAKRQPNASLDCKD